MPKGVIKLNPAAMSDQRDALAIAWNEGIRLWMEDSGYVPETEPTEEQAAALSETAYADDPEAMAKTVLARIITRDTSAPNPTPEQLAEASKILTMILQDIGEDHQDAEAVKLLMEGLVPQAPDAGVPEDQMTPESGTPPPEGSEQMQGPAGAGAMPPEGVTFDEASTEVEP